MRDWWQQGDSMHTIARLFDRGYGNPASIHSIDIPDAVETRYVNCSVH